MATKSLTFLNAARDASNSSRLGHSRNKSAESKRSSTATTSKSRQSSHSSKNSVTSVADMIPPGLTDPHTPSVSSLASIEGPLTPTYEDSPTHPIRPPPPLPKDNIVETTVDVADTLNLFNAGWTALPSPPTSPKRSSQSLPDSYFGQQADVFSLGCVFLDILTYMVKKKISEFVKHRTTKRRPDVATPLSPPGPVPQLSQMPSNKSSTDASFHNNLGKLTSWTEILNTDAAAQDDVTYRAIPQLLRLILWMLSPNPLSRPSAEEVRERIFDILIGHAGIDNVCCHSSQSATSAESRRPIPPPKESQPFGKADLKPPPKVLKTKKSFTSLASNNKGAGPSSPNQNTFSGFVKGLRWPRKTNVGPS